MLKLLFVFLTFPFRLLFNISKFVFSFVGKTLSLILGIFLLIIGIVFSITIVGIFIGIPTVILGLSLIMSALFK